jgi:hypothetical protein
MRQALAALAVTLVLAPMAPAVRASTPTESSPLARAGDHKDERFGFTFKAPKKWKSIALKSDEGWLAAKYLSNKSYFYTDDTGWTNEHQPELMVIAFQHANQKRKNEVTEKDEDGVTVTTITINNPYKDYEDFLDRTYVGGGWYVDKKVESKLGDLKVTKYEVKVEKLSRTGPKRIVTWIYHVDDIDFAMQIEVLEPEYKKLKKVIDRSLKSFAEIERNGDLLPKGGATGETIRFTRRELTSGTPKERRTVRMKSQRALHEKAIAGLPKDWDHKYHGDVLVINHKQSKWADRLGTHAQLVLKWIDKNFEYFGEGEYARAPVIRVCEDQDEENAFSRGVVSGSGGNYVFVLPGSEIITHKDDEGWIGFEVGWVNRMILNQWLADRDDDLAASLPEWVQTGIYAYIEGARQSGRKLDWRVDQWDKDNARLAASQGRATSPRQIVRYTREGFASDSSGMNAETYFGRRAEATMLVRYLMSKESGRCKQAKGLLKTYILTLEQVVEEIKEKGKDDLSVEAPKTEEEEEEQAKARAGRWRNREKELMDETFSRVFGGWTDKDWQAFEKAYMNWLK